MKISLFFGSIIVSECSHWRRGHLQPINLRENSEVTFKKVISAELGETQDFVCPRDQEFELYLVSRMDYYECNTLGQRALLKCNTPWRENKVSCSFRWTKLMTK